MRLRSTTSAVLGAATVLGLALATGAPAHAASTVPATAVAPTANPAIVTPAPSVTLLTGEKVQMGTDASGRPSVHVIRTNRPAAAAAVSTDRIGTALYIVPTIAQPYLGRFLDPALFNVTALARSTNRTRVAVRLTYQGTATPALAGITVTAASAGIATGYLTAASARTFGAALMHQYSADRRAGWPVRTTLMGRVTRVALAGASGGGPAVPQFPMQTLIINVLGTTGAPAQFAFAELANVDDGRKFGEFIPVLNGQARVSVPVGHYAGLVEVGSFDPTSFAGSLSLVLFDNYSVVRNGQTLTLDARTARSKLAVRTPRPAAVLTESWEWDRTPGGGDESFASGFNTGPGVDLYTAAVPTPPTALGTLNSVSSWSLAGSPSAGPSYTYDLAFAATGVPATQSHVVRSAELATVRASYHSEGPLHPGAFARSATFAFQAFGFLTFSPIVLPSLRTEYVQDAPTAVWTAVLLADTSADDPFAALWGDGSRVARAGSTTDAVWLAGPLVPTVPFVTDGSSAGRVTCPVCRTAHAMQLILAPVTDSTPGHVGTVVTPPDGSRVARLRVYANGALIFDGSNTVGGQFPVAAGAATYTVVDDVDRRFGGAIQSTVTHTELTFPSSASSGAHLPGSWRCELGAACTIPAVLQAAVSLPTDLTGIVPIGRSVLDVAYTQIQGATPAKITSATVEVRVRSGSWRTLTGAALGGGRYRFALITTAAQAGASVDLRVSGADAHGSRIIQTTANAFVIASS